MFRLIWLAILYLGAAVAIEYPVYHHAVPRILKPALVKTLEIETPAHYDFSYSVHDDHTGDVKSQTESRKGDQVHGKYSLIDADGYLRTVEYTSDANHGFNAVVRREPLGHKVVKAIAPVAKIAYATPKVYAAHKLTLGQYEYSL